MDDDASRAATDAPPRSWVGAGFLTSGRAVTLLVVATGLVMLLGALELAPGVYAVASLVAFLPLPLYLAAVLWLDRLEPEPRAMLATAFFWGASVAVLFSGLFNAVADAIVGEAVGTAVTGPIAEECLKAVILFRFYKRRPDEFDDVMDGLVYAGMVGLGFACVENIDYYGRSLAQEGAGGLAVTFTLRGVMSPFSHPLFTAMTGIGLGLARQTRRGWVRATAPVLGLCAAALLHGLWNASTQMGCVFFAIYALVMMPALAIVFVVAAVSLRRQGRIIRQQFAQELAAGTLSADDVEQFAGVRRRVTGSWSAWRRDGRDVRRERRHRQRTATELAFLRHRVAQGTQPPDPELEAAYLAALGLAVQAPAPELEPDAVVVCDAPPPEPPGPPDVSGSSSG